MTWMSFTEKFPLGMQGKSAVQDYSYPLRHTPLLSDLSIELLIVPSSGVYDLTLL